MKNNSNELADRLFPKYEDEIGVDTVLNIPPEKLIMILL